MKRLTLSASLILLFSNLLFAQGDVIFKSNFEMPTTTQLNDTGVTWAGEYTYGNNTNCTSSTISSPQDCNNGRDATHNDNSDGHAGFSFTKLDVNGQPLADQSANYATTPWTCVKDNVTGLIWEVKTNDGGIHDKDNTYKWGGITHLGDNYGTYYNDWDSLVNGSNNENLCGFTTWRIATTNELISIVDNSRYSPSIDINYFPNIIDSNFWSALPLAFDDSRGWYVSFFYGYTYHTVRTNNLNALLVTTNP